ncbi:two-component response regulator 24-like [Rutidosis leptorrhynchoides]|uniref:two-component response regulator 24-like n=1 Tax=Rutidosis leptorrhynchoides TaxID=125765 RepID=UPI003A99C382
MDGGDGLTMEERSRRSVVVGMSSGGSLVVTRLRSVEAAADRMRALIVDDDLVIRMIHSKLLNNFGIENQMVVNRKEALDVHSAGKKFDLIMMDMDMPVMNGIKATKKLREMGVHSLIAGVSSRSIEQEKQKFMRAGLDDYQKKLLTSDKLFSILNKVNYKEI